MYFQEKLVHSTVEDKYKHIRSSTGHERKIVEVTPIPTKGRVDE